MTCEEGGGGGRGVDQHWVAHGAVAQGDGGAARRRCVSHTAVALHWQAHAQVWDTTASHCNGARTVGGEGIIVCIMHRHHTV
jgi:hypothetical protein